MPMWFKKNAPAETKARGFKDKRSYVSIKEGVERLKLFGADMTAQRDRVIERDGYRCQYCKKRFNYYELEIGHDPIPRGKGGSDDMDNLKTACKMCHREEHVQVRWSRRAERA